MVDCVVLTPPSIPRKSLETRKRFPEAKSVTSRMFQAGQPLAESHSGAVV